MTVKYLDLDYQDLIYATAKRREIIVFNVDTDKIISQYYFSFSPKGWHPFTAVLREYIDNSKMNYEQSILKKYYSQFQPNNQQELFFENNDIATELASIAPN